MALQESYYNLASSDTYPGVTDNDDWVAQTFTPSVSHQLSKVNLFFTYSSGSSRSGNIVVSIKATDGSGKPTGANLISKTLAANTVTAIYPIHEWVEFVFPSTITVTAGVTYAIVCNTVGGDTGTDGLYWQIGFAAGGEYQGGQLWESGDGGSTWSDESITDAWFGEYDDFDPPGSGGYPGQLYGGPDITSVRKLVAAAANTIYYEDI